MKNIVILGSTGSIGQSALRVIEDHPDLFRVVGLTAHRNTPLLIEQARKFRPRAVAVADRAAVQEVRSGLDIPVLEGTEGVSELAALGEADFVISAIVGSHGLMPTLSAIRAGKTIGLANKETLVMAGEFVMREARAHGVEILPIDSEHSAIFQCLEGRAPESVRKLILTASGGPFVGWGVGELQDVTPEAALKHPSWSMGRKITVDSATLMNKGLEVIEAHHLFGPWMIEVVVHPQSIIHSMVEFIDGSCLAQLSIPDMRGAIAYAMSCPCRIESVIPRMNLPKIGSFTFLEPDRIAFPCLALAYEALGEGGTMPAVLNAANEIAVDGFLDGRIGFMDIPKVIRKTMEAHVNGSATEIGGILDAHHEAILMASELVGIPAGGARQKAY